MTQVISDIYSAALVTQRDIDNWLSRLELSTEFAPTVSGRRRLYTKPNTLELAFLKAGVKAGMKASTAASYAASFVRGRENGNGLGTQRWLAFPMGDPSSAISGDELDVEFINRAKGDQDGVTIIDVAAIVGRVDAAFAEAAKWYVPPPR